MNNKNDGELDGDDGEGGAGWLGPERTKKTPMLGMKNYHQWYQWHLMEMSSAEGLMEFAESGEKPNFQPRGLASVSKTEKESGGGGFDVDKAQYELALRRAWDKEDRFEAALRRYVVRWTRSITDLVLDKIRLDRRYEDALTKRFLKGLFAIAEQTTKGVGTASVYLDFTQLFEMKLKGGEWSGPFRSFVDTRRRIRGRVASGEFTWEELLERLMNTMFIMGCKNDPRLDTQIKQIMGSSKWPTADDLIDSFSQYLTLTEQMDGNRSAEVASGAVIANAASVKTKAQGGGYGRHKKCLNCMGQHLVKECGEKPSECGDCGGPHATEMHREAERLNDRVRARHSMSHCEAEFEKCKSRLKGPAPKAFSAIAMDQTEEQELTDYVRWLARVTEPDLGGMRAMAGKIKDENLDRMRVRYIDDFEICSGSDDEEAYGMGGRVSGHSGGEIFWDDGENEVIEDPGDEGQDIAMMAGLQAGMYYREDKADRERGQRRREELARVLSRDSSGGQKRGGNDYEL